jgi:phage terminase large subunit GpA-like protein
MTPAAERLRDAIKAVYAPIDRRTVTEWTEGELVLSERQTSMPGFFSTALTPYMRGPLECFGDVDVTDVVLCWGSQTGKTTMIQAGVAWRIVNRPQPTVWVMPTESLAASFSETRWLPICEDSPAVAALIPRDKNKWKKLEQHFARSSLVFVGSNSPANLASRPAGLLLMDEIDKLAQETDRETSALFLAENRTKSFAGALRVKTSTPTTPDGPIWSEYQKGTQEKYILECPHCKERIELLWEQVKWLAQTKEDIWKAWTKDESNEVKKAFSEWVADLSFEDLKKLERQYFSAAKPNLSAVEATAHYACQRCGGAINDGQKMEMLQTGVWQATNENSLKGFRSFHLNSLYAPWRSCTFGALAVKFIRDKETINGLQDFTNSAMALPWEQIETSIGEPSVLALRGDYMRGTCPIEPVFCLTCADVGQDQTHWATVAFAEDGESAVLDYGRVLAVEDMLLPEIIARQYATPSGGTVASQCGLIDSGFATFRVYGACQTSAGFYHPAKGSKATFGSRITTTTLDNFPGVVLYTYADHSVKTELFIDRIKRGKPRLQIPRDSSDEFIRGLCGQMLVPRKTASGKEFVWKEVREDHFMDAVKLAHIGWHVLKVEA